MEFKKLIDRTKETDRIKSALHRDSTQFIVVYGRRRKGEIPTFHKEKRGQEVHLVLFLKEQSSCMTGNVRIVLPDDVMGT